MFVATTATRRVLSLQKRIRAIQGGTSASKTISVILLLIDLAQRDKIATVTSIVSESFPHLKRGAMKDFLSIMKEHEYYDDNRWNKTDSTYTFETSSKIEFFSADQPGKVRGPRRDRLFINEANNVEFETFEQLEVRTKEFVILDWNPTNEYWFYTDVLNKRDDVDHITLTYKDNEALAPEIVRSIELRMNRKGWWQVYGLGQLGEVEGKIYKDWQIIDTVPHEAKLVRKDLITDILTIHQHLLIYIHTTVGYIIDELMYQKELSNKQIADTILAGTPALTIADSSEPKSNDEIKSYGVNIVGALKGKDSVLHGIQIVQDQRISVTKRSINVIREYRNYLWITDKDGKILNEPEHTFSHSMDAVRYAIASLKQPDLTKVTTHKPNLKGYNRTQ